MIPIWAKDRNGKWHVFPHDSLTTFEDGEQGYIWTFDMSTIQRLETDQKFRKWDHLFTYDTANRRFVLTKQFKSE